MSDHKDPSKKQLKRAVDGDLIRDLAKLLEETALSEIEIEDDDFRVRVARHAAAATVYSAPAAPAQPAAPAATSAPAPAQTESGAQHPGAVKSPMVGTAYMSPKPGDPPYVREGDQVSEGQTLLIIEAMKTMNPIPSPRAGTVKSILVDNEQPVEFGEPLLIIE